MENLDRNIYINVKLRTINNLLANIDIGIETERFGYVIIKGFSLWKSEIFNSRLNAHVYIAPAQIKRKGMTFKFYHFEDEDKWFKLEELIYEAYLKKIEEIP